MLDQLTQWATSSLFNTVLTLVIIIVLVLVSLYLVKIAAGRLTSEFIETTTDLDRRARLHITKGAQEHPRLSLLPSEYSIGLSTIGIDIGPAWRQQASLDWLYRLAQTLIKEHDRGLTILLEDEYRGDYVKIGTVSGEVEEITLRRTDLRDAEGRLFMVPNGDVRIVANETRDWARALVVLNFRYGTALDKPYAALEKALERLAADPNLKQYLLAAPEFFGWDGLNDWAVVVKLSVKVSAGKRDEVTRELRQYALEALHEAVYLLKVFPLKIITPVLFP
jgi:small conductance mechanosensitive channel